MRSSPSAADRSVSLDRINSWATVIAVAENIIYYVML